MITDVDQKPFSKMPSLLNEMKEYTARYLELIATALLLQNQKLIKKDIEAKILQLKADKNYQHQEFIDAFGFIENKCQIKINE